MMLPRRRRAACLLAAVALTAAGCTATRSAPVPPPPPAADAAGGAGTQARWRPCPEVAQELIRRVPAGVSYECATIRVPRDWTAAKPGAPGGTTAGPGTTPGAGSPGASPGGSPGASGGSPGASPGTAGPAGAGSFDIALLRARSSQQRNRIGSLVVNPGGPGGSGVNLAVYLSAGLPLEISRRFDIVGFDPRGVGRSTAVECISDADLDESFAYDPDPVSQSAFDGLVALTRTIGAGCGARYGNSLRLFSTEQAARDMDAVRAAVGDEKITYLGYSYGTLLGATYAQLFPRRIRALVLDGAVDPRQGLIEGSESQAIGFERAFNNMAAWCRDRGALCPIGPDARATVTAALDAARRAPVRGGDGRPATAGWIMTAVVSSLYTQPGWTELASAISRLGRGDASGVFTLADRYAERDSSGRYSNLFDANTAVNCADEDERPTVARIRELQGQWRAKYPLFGALLAVSLLSCAQWPGGRDPYPTGPATGAPPVVVVGTTGDPATPYEQTPRLARMLGVGVVLTWQGEGHTAYPESRCITQAVNAYLIEVRVPSPGLTCPAR